MEAVHHNSSDSNTNLNLSPVQAQVIAALAQGRTITDAARDAGLHRTTIHTWFRDQPVFTTAYEDAQREYVAVLQDGMRDLAARAVETLRSLLDDPNTPPAVRLRTALSVLQQSGWHLPEPIESPREDSPSVSAEAPSPSPAPASDPIARNAPCPCGSGEKYKRCCGRASAGKFTPPGKAA